MVRPKTQPCGSPRWPAQANYHIFRNRWLWEARGHVADPAWKVRNGTYQGGEKRMLDLGISIEERSIQEVTPQSLHQVHACVVVWELDAHCGYGWPDSALHFACLGTSQSGHLQLWMDQFTNLSRKNLFWGQNLCSQCERLSSYHST